MVLTDVLGRRTGAVAAVLVTGCGASDGSASSEEPESDTPGKRVTVGDTEAIVWGEGVESVALIGASAGARTVLQKPPRTILKR